MVALVKGVVSWGVWVLPLPQLTLYDLDFEQTLYDLDFAQTLYDLDYEFEWAIVNIKGLSQHGLYGTF